MALKNSTALRTFNDKDGNFARIYSGEAILQLSPIVVTELRSDFAKNSSHISGEPVRSHTGNPQVHERNDVCAPRVDGAGTYTATSDSTSKAVRF